MKDLLLSILTIFSYAGKVVTFFRNFILNIVFFILLLFIVIGFFTSQDLEISSNSVLRLDISGSIVEERKMLGSLEHLLGSSFSEGEEETETLLQDVLDVISAAKDDSRIKAILLNLSHFRSGGLNQLQAIGNALTDFRKAGKHVIAAEDFYSQSQYYLASHADTIFLHPLGAIDIHGFGVYRLYYKDALDKLDINYHIFKVGDYKSALEPITRTSMSAQDREQNQQWLDALWDIYCADISKQRVIEKSVLTRYTHEIDTQLDQFDGDSALLAKEIGLVDRIATRQEIKAYITEKTGAEFDGNRLLTSGQYLNTLSDRSFTSTSSRKDKVGLIIAEGSILPGKQPPGFIGADSLAQMINNACEDENIKSIVLRINSPGGSAHASEIIRQALLEAKKKGKPIVISMGTVAASGGYWLAVAGDEIWASPSTLTGSIGVFGAIPTFEKTIENIGVRSDGIGTTPLAAGLDVTQPLAPQLGNAIQASVRHTYQTFVNIVAEGRGLSQEEVEQLAEGRVYDGGSAKELGLVDHLGDLPDALNGAAKLAGLLDYSIELVHPEKTVQDQVMEFLTSRSTEALIPEQKSLIPARLTRQFQTTLKNIQTLFQLQDPRHVYAYCQFDLQL